MKKTRRLGKSGEINNMTIDENEKAKHLLLGGLWCETHDMPVIYTEENTWQFIDTQEETVVITNYCLDCIKELPDPPRAKIILSALQEDLLR